MSIECEFCKKKYSNIHTLKTHQQTTKFCLKIQDKINIKDKLEDIEKKIFSCDYCNKEFLLKASLKDHLKICKKKIEDDISLETNKISFLENKIKELELNEIKNEELLSLKYNSTINEKENEIKFKNEYINKLEKDIIELKNNMLELKNENKELKNKYESIMNDIKNEKMETDKYLLEKACSKTNYNMQFNNLLNEIVPFNDENIISRISKMNAFKIYQGSDKIDESFITDFVDVVKDMTFCTDVSRGSLIVKHDEGTSEKISSKKFVLECFKKGNKELIDACYTIHDIVNNSKDMDVYKQAKIRGELGSIITYLKENKLNSMVTNTANKIIHDCKQLSKK
jgi:hypothetical protein